MHLTQCHKFEIDLCFVSSFSVRYYFDSCSVSPFSHFLFFHFKQTLTFTIFNVVILVLHQTKQAYVELRTIFKNEKLSALLKVLHIRSLLSTRQLLDSFISFEKHRFGIKDTFRYTFATSESRRTIRSCFFFFCLQNMQNIAIAMLSSFILG